jgi:hypothetical protein
MRRSVLVSIFASTVLVAGVAPALASNQRIWLHTFTGGSNLPLAKSIAVDPGNGQVYALNEVDCCLLSSSDTVAYKADGTKLWTMNSGDPVHDEPDAITVDLATHDVLVTGRRSKGMFTEAYSASGTLLWTTVRKVSGYELAPVGIVSDGHGRAVVEAQSRSDSLGTLNFLTIAYQMSSGARLWLSRYGVSNSDDPAVGIAADPGKRQVYVVGSSMGTNFQELVTIGYDSDTGAQAWLARDTGGNDNPIGIAVDTSSHHVFAVSETAVEVLQWDTFAYSATGGRLWHSTYQNPDGFNASPQAVTTDSANGQVYVAGEQRTATSGTLNVLVAYSSSGAQSWAQTYNDGAASFTRALATDTSNHRVYVSGERTNSSGETITMTRGVTSTGSTAWTATVTSPVTNGGADPAALAVDGGRGQVYLTGTESNASGGANVFTAAYHA